MSWETRKGRRYYYRAIRVDGRLVKQYFGRGTAAEEQARQDAVRRRDRVEQRQAQQQHRQSYDQLSALSAQADGILEMVLLAAGYHRHARGPWRKKRGEAKI